MNDNTSNQIYDIVVYIIYCALRFPATVKQDTPVNYLTFFVNTVPAKYTRSRLPLNTGHEVARICD